MEGILREGRTTERIKMLPRGVVGGIIDLPQGGVGGYRADCDASAMDFF